MDVGEWVPKVLNNAHFIIAEEGRTLTGFAAHYANDDWCFLTMIHVASDYRGRGIGKKMLDELKSAFGTIELEVLRSNPAVHLYDRGGFKIEESRSSDVALYMSWKG